MAVHGLRVKRTDTTMSNTALEDAQPRLIQHLKQAIVSYCSSEKILFHGCTDRSKHTDILGKKLMGDFKWMSEDPAYAAEYGFYEGAEGGAPFLFVCSLQRETIAVEDRQCELHKLTDWGAAAPARFPVEFESHAKEALDTADPIIFLDHFQTDTGKWREILVPNPEGNVTVLDVVPLPPDKEAAKRSAAAYCRQLYSYL